MQNKDKPAQMTAAINPAIKTDFIYSVANVSTIRNAVKQEILHRCALNVLNHRA